MRMLLHAPYHLCLEDLSFVSCLHASKCRTWKRVTVTVLKHKYKRRILAGIRTYFAAISLFRSRLLSRATEIILYRTLIRPAVSCGAEAWTLTKKEEQALLIFEMKIFRRIYGPKYENGNGNVGRIEN